MNRKVQPDQRICFTPTDNRRLALLCGQFNENLSLLENHFNIQIHHRGNEFHLIGDELDAQAAGNVLKYLYQQTLHADDLALEKIHLRLQEIKNHGQPSNNNKSKNNTIRTKLLTIAPRGLNQINYIENISKYDVTFSTGPAGTGKTFLAVACAVEALESDQVSRLILVRPAVEAGERLGFLPGDLSQKVDPYLRPIYDALYEMLGFERVTKLIERGIIELAPLAYMRGRTLNDSFIILDEAQNTTKKQMKMFLTRIGFGSTAVITGDLTQIDLPGDEQSGLQHAIDVLEKTDDIGFSEFFAKDVVRHPLAQKIVIAYDNFENKSGK